MSQRSAQNQKNHADGTLAESLELASGITSYLQA
jgi:hypothetical protein